MRQLGSSWRMTLATFLIAVLALGPVSGVEAGDKTSWFSARGCSQQGLATETPMHDSIHLIARPTLAGTAMRVTLETPPAPSSR